YLGIIAETYERVGTETGGILLGKFVRGRWYVLESLDPGPKSIFSPAYFEYDTPYVNHLANKIERFYKSGLELIGLWHRHPGNFSSFSATDDNTNIKYASQNSRGALSALVNLVPEFKLTVYHVAIPLHYTPINFQVNDEMIPPEIKELKTFTDYIPSQNAHLTSRIPVSSTSKPVIRRSVQPVTKRCCRLLSWMLRINKSESHNSSLAKHTETIDRQLDMGNAKPEKFPDSSKETVLDMIESEFIYLESQNDYDYSLKIAGNEVVISLSYIQRFSNNPKSIGFVFGINNQKGYVKINRGCYRYTPNFLRDHFNCQISYQLK
ncbi:MAG: hypothetical protein FJY07_11620, partial [Bacteroidetes bacterium]|nr:hypothetical protein [Bacteroidota bacterium]